VEPIAYIMLLYGCCCVLTVYGIIEYFCKPKDWGQEEASRPKLFRHDDDDDDDCDYGDDEDDKWLSLSVRLSRLQISAQSPAVLTHFMLPCSHSSVIPMSGGVLPLPFTSGPINYSLIVILPPDALQLQTLMSSLGLNGKQISLN